MTQLINERILVEVSSTEVRVGVSAVLSLQNIIRAIREGGGTQGDFQRINDLLSKSQQSMLKKNDSVDLSEFNDIKVRFQEEKKELLIIVRSMRFLFELIAGHGRNSLEHALSLLDVLGGVERYEPKDLRKEMEDVLDQLGYLFGLSLQEMQDLKRAFYVFSNSKGGFSSDEDVLSDLKSAYQSSGGISSERIEKAKEGVGGDLITFTIRLALTKILNHTSKNGGSYIRFAVNNRRVIMIGGKDQDHTRAGIVSEAGHLILEYMGGQHIDKDSAVHEAFDSIARLAFGIGFAEDYDLVKKGFFKLIARKSLYQWQVTRHKAVEYDNQNISWAEKFFLREMQRGVGRETIYATDNKVATIEAHPGVFENLVYAIVKSQSLTKELIEWDDQLLTHALGVFMAEKMVELSNGSALRAIAVLAYMLKQNDKEEWMKDHELFFKTFQSIIINKSIMQEIEARLDRRYAVVVHNPSGDKNFLDRTQGGGLNTYLDSKIDEAMIGIVTVREFEDIKNMSESQLLAVYNEERLSGILRMEAFRVFMMKSSKEDVRNKFKDLEKLSQSLIDQVSTITVDQNRRLFSDPSGIYYLRNYIMAVYVQMATALGFVMLSNPILNKINGALISGNISFAADSDFHFNKKFLFKHEGVDKRITLMIVHEVMHNILYFHYDFNSKGKARSIVHEWIAYLSELFFSQKQGWASILLDPNLFSMAFRYVGMEEGVDFVNAHKIADSQNHSIWMVLGNGCDYDKLLRAALQTVSFLRVRNKYQSVLKWREVYSIVPISFKGFVRQTIIRYQDSSLAKAIIEVIGSDDVNSQEELSIDEIMKLTGATTISIFNNTGRVSFSDLARKLQQRRKSNDPDSAMTIRNPGGIDLTPKQMDKALQSTGNGEIKFKIDAAQLAQLQNATGFTPIVNDIQPMTDLKVFLGITNSF